MPPEPGWNSPGLEWHDRCYRVPLGDFQPVVVLRHEVEQRTTSPADGAVKRLEGLGRRRALRFVQDREILRGERGVVGQVRVTKVRTLNERGHRQCFTDFARS